jgi:hypothetical protein
MSMRRALSLPLPRDRACNVLCCDNRGLVVKRTTKVRGRWDLTALSAAAADISTSSACCLRGVHDMKDGNLLSSSASFFARFASTTAVPGGSLQSFLKNSLSPAQAKKASPETSEFLTFVIIE